MGDRFCEPIFRFLRMHRIKPFIDERFDVLDVGCGEKGLVVKTLSPHVKTITGIDIRSTPYEVGNAKIISGSFDGVPLPFKDKSFDCVLLLAVLEHIHHREELMREIYRILRPNGKLVLTVPTWAAKPILEFLAFRLHIVSEIGVREHKIYFWKDQLRNLLEKAEFDASHITINYFEFGVNLSAVVRK